MFCPNCGMETEGDSVFCDNCGASLLDDANASAAQMPPSPPYANQPIMTPPAQPVQQMPAQKKSKAPVIIVIVVLVLVIAGIAIAFAMGGGDGKKASSDAIEHQVVFETYGGSQYKDATFKTGTIIDTPNNPARAGSTFEGWFADATFTEPVTFPYTIAGEDPEIITFYAKWSENASASAATGSMDYMSDTTSVLDDLLGQQSLERSKYDGSVSNAQNWRDYLSGRVDTARQENSDFWNNVWNVVKGVGNAVKTGYDAYQGYYQWDKEFELQKQQYADMLRALS